MTRVWQWILSVLVFAALVALWPVWAVGLVVFVARQPEVLADVSEGGS